MRLLSKSKRLILVLVMLVPTIASAANIKPFSLAQRSTDNLTTVTAQVREKLVKNGFQVVGSYKPYNTTDILIVTNKALKKVAAKTTYGGFGAALRVAITSVKNNKGKKEIQVIYNNPTYIGIAYNMNSRLTIVKDSLKKALGFIEDFGGGDGVDEEDLPDYNYAFGLEGFTEFYEFVIHKDYRDAFDKVEKSLAKNKFGISKAYRIDIPGIIRYFFV